MVLILGRVMIAELQCAYTMYKQLWCKEITSAVILAALHLPTTQLSCVVAWLFATNLKCLA